MSVLVKNSHFVPEDAVKVYDIVAERYIELVSDPSAVMGRYQIRFVVTRPCRVPGGYLRKTYYTKVYAVTAAKFVGIATKLHRGEVGYVERFMPNGGYIRHFDRTVRRKRDDK